MVGKTSIKPFSSENVNGKSGRANHAKRRPSVTPPIDGLFLCMVERKVGNDGKRFWFKAVSLLAKKVHQG